MKLNPESEKSTPLELISTLQAEELVVHTTGHTTDDEDNQDADEITPAMAHLWIKNLEICIKFYLFK